jgi:hypothetical protein
LGTKEGGRNGAAAGERGWLETKGDLGRRERRSKDNLECDSRRDGGFIAGKAMRGAIPDRVGRLEAGLRLDVAALRISLSHCALSSNAIVSITGLNVVSGEHCQRVQVRPIGDGIGSPKAHPGSPGVTQLRAASP